MKRVSATGDAPVFSKREDAAVIVGLSKNGSVTDAGASGIGLVWESFQVLIPDA